MLKELNSKNNGLNIKHVTSESFLAYGNIISGCDFSEMFDDSLAAVDLTGPTYCKDLESLHKYRSFDFLKNEIFGEIEIQAGLCFGNNVKMNGMEYHKSSEVLIAVTDVILILGKLTDIKESSWDSSLAECFYIPKGTAIELFAGVLHLAPCRVDENPFCTIIVLPKGTNSPLKNNVKEGSLLFMENKWLICHKESPAVARGGYVGITGENITIKV